MDVRPTKRSRASPGGGSQSLVLSGVAKARRRVVPYKRKAVRRRVGSARFGFALPSPSTRILNPSGVSSTLHFNKTTTLTAYTGAGAGTQYPIIISPSTSQMPQFATYSPLFTKMRVNYIKVIYELITTEQTDDALLPNIVMRYCHDPDQTTVPFSLSYFNGFKDVVKKTLTATDNRLEYTFFPQVMTGGLQTAAGTYMPMPRKCGWIDATQDVNLYGAMALLTPFGTGEQIVVSLEWDVDFAEPR